MRRLARFVTAAVILAVGASAARAADDAADPPTIDTSNARLFGVLPNYTTVDGTRVPNQTTHDSFRAAALGSFDPVVFPFIGVMTLVGNGDANANYETRYSRAFADNTIGNFMTTAIVPSLTNEDSRYFRRGEGGVLSRLAYAASRSVVTRTRSGGATFNISEIGGTAAAAGLSNIYYSPADRTVGATLTRWGTQVMWDTVSNELKEFWPDIHAKLHRH
jgi:hypothetical protein